MTARRVIENAVHRLRGSLGNSTPGDWRWARVHPDTPMRDHVEVLTTDGRRVMNLRTDDCTDYRIQDIVLACQAHNHMGPVLDELGFQAGQAKAAFEALRRAHDILLEEKFARPTDMAALKVMRDALKDCRILDLDPSKPRPRRRALNIPE